MLKSLLMKRLSILFTAITLMLWLAEVTFDWGSLPCSHTSSGAGSWPRTGDPAKWFQQQIQNMSPTPSPLAVRCPPLNLAPSTLDEEDNMIAVLGEVQLKPDSRESEEEFFTQEQVEAWLGDVLGLVGNAAAILTSLTTLIHTQPRAEPILSDLSSMTPQLIVSLANTGIAKHTSDEEAATTARALDASNIHWLGVRAKKRLMIILRERGEASRVGLLAFCGAYKDCGKGAGLPFSPLKYSFGGAKAAIQDLKGLGVRAVVVLVNWGSETSYYPEETALTIARQLATLGANAVLGHHPHTVHDHAYFGNTLVVFSLGKLLSSIKDSNYCWNKMSGKMAYMYSTSKPCSMVHPNSRQGLLTKEMKTRIYKLHLTKENVFVADYTTIPLVDEVTEEGYSVRRPKETEEMSDYTWTRACSDSDRHCLACRHF